MFIPFEGEAVRCFRLLTDISLALGVIDWDTFEERHGYLDELLGEPDNQPYGGGQGRGGDVEVAPEGVHRADGEAWAHPNIIDKVVATTAMPDWIRFIPSGGIGHLKRWHFIKGDPDPLPSVPHGHDEGRPFPKLDPYLGHIHTSTASKGGRLSKDDTRALWNDGRFRDFASAALVHFVRENPRHVWRVDSPLRIPRRRRPPG